MQTFGLRILLLTCLAFLSLEAGAQTASSKWGLSIGGGLLTYQSFPQEPAMQFKHYDPVFSFSGLRYLNGGFDFRTQLAYSPAVRMPSSPTEFTSTSLVDMNYQLMFKFNNGVFFKESAFVAPYLLLGIGGSYTENNPDAYVPLGGGIRFRFGPRLAMRIETVKKLSLNKNYQNLAHAISFVYNIETDDSPLEQLPPEQLEQELIVALMPKDRDHDGIVDLHDRCPDLAGFTEFLGCPEEMGGKEAYANVEDNSAVKPPEEQELDLAALFDQPYQDPAALPDGEPSGWVGDLSLLDELADRTEEAKQNASVQDVVWENQVEENTIQSYSDPYLNPQEQVDGNPALRKPETGYGPCAEYGEVASEMAPVLFEEGSHDLNINALDQLNDIAEAMKVCSDVQLVLNGHADAIGDNSDNLVLSIMRAYKVKYYLVYEHGISQKRILSQGMGEDNPMASNHTMKGREQNRRVDFELVY